jgi:hypothetical protein
MMLSGSRRTCGGVIGKDWFFTDPRPRFNNLGWPASVYDLPAGERSDRPAASVSPREAVRAATAWHNDDGALDDNGTLDDHWAAGHHDNRTAIDDASAIRSTMEAGAASACRVGATETCEGAGN